ncbi:hypothetical protein E2C01_061897 [Portunus trituberculatus]|uniref:Uncharacterized protein n=1 Tax=Portunus trituberculatus TaxID=210409 RepID=A0A5B7HCM0_PORTR|nr:hypothetical protein [Portunus trituberculatus]
MPIDSSTLPTSIASSHHLIAKHRPLITSTTKHCSPITSPRNTALLSLLPPSTLIPITCSHA